MKRYRVFTMDFDSRALLLAGPVGEDRPSEDQQREDLNRAEMISRLVEEYGSEQFAQKYKNFIDLGVKPFSIVAFHNRFHQQVRNAFVLGSYYPALVGTCALGERILNHLVLLLREEFKDTAEYKKIYRKASFDNWGLAIETLESWEVLEPQAAAGFRRLESKRHDSIHFRPEVDKNDREIALGAIECLRSILESQFSGFGPAPWLYCAVPGEVYIRKEWESRPFVRRVYVPNCALVGPLHEIEEVGPPWVVRDDQEYEAREISDEDFAAMRAIRGVD